VTANVAKLTEQVSALAALGRALAAGPVGKAAAVTYGVRRAVGMRRPNVRGGQRLIATPAISAPGSAPGSATGSAPGRRPADGLGR
jgi:hypothetical protein